MRTITLTQDKISIVDDADYESVSCFKWYAARNVRKPDGKRMTLTLHRFLLPGVEEIDHIDGDGLNNQRANLRPASNRQNQQAFQRKREGTSSSFRGVHWRKDRQKWRAQIQPDGKTLHLGCFTSEREAVEAYDTVARQLFGEFASPNFKI